MAKKYGFKLSKKDKDKLIGLIIVGVIAIFKILTESSVNISNDPIDGVEVHFIDVGQGDSQLIIDEDKVMLIDSGEREYGEQVLNYIKKLGINKIDYIVATHPHSDHIGGLSDIINGITVENVIMPNVSHNTRAYEKLVLGIKENNINLIEPVVGDIFDFNNTKYTIFGPNSSYYEDNLNNYSVCIRMDHDEVSFLFTGDAEWYAENEMLDNGYNLDVDVYKVAHHGSGTSNTKNFLREVSPTVAVISCGVDNSYNHPHDNAMERILEVTSNIYRTDQDGTVVVASDGENISITKEK